MPKQPVAVKPKLARAKIGVLVLNGNGRTGAARRRSRARCSTSATACRDTANAARHDYATTVVMYRPGFRAEGMRLARDLHVKVVGPLDGLKPAALHGAKLASSSAPARSLARRLRRR